MFTVYSLISFPSSLESQHTVSPELSILSAVLDWRSRQSPIKIGALDKEIGVGLSALP